MVIVTFRAALGILSVVSIQFLYLCHKNTKNIFVLGKPHANSALFAVVIGGLGLLGSFTYAYAFKDRERKKKTE